MNKVLEYFIKHKVDNVLVKNITVYGWQKTYNHTLVGSVSNYLFEDFSIIENIAPITNENRDGRKRKKYYITVHDTGDSNALHSARFWSDTVKNQCWEEGEYKASYQYVVGNDGIYHQIPDDEIAYHAGDSTKYDYCLYDTGVTGTNKDPAITISTDGYYVIDGNKTTVKSPNDDNHNLSTIDINTEGILCKLIDEKYYIGETYYNSSFKYIANRGGNNNSIGIESCINEGTDIYLTWQRTAKLVAHLLVDNNLSIDDVKQHHYFSGKNCPQTMRMNDMWNHFLSLVSFEKDMYLFLKEGYVIQLLPETDLINNNGRLTIPLNQTTLSYTIRTIKDGVVEEWKNSIKIM